MRIFITTHSGLAIQFQPDSEEEGEALDRLLRYKGTPIPIELGGFNPDSEGSSPRYVAELDGHESARWIIISFKEILRLLSNAIKF